MSEEKTQTRFSAQTISFWLFFVLLIVIRFFPFLYGKTLVFGDNYSLMMPGKIFTAEWIQQGVFPLWNPYVFSGMPWISDINQSVLYPSTVLFLLFQPVIAFNLLLISHALIAYSGMYLFTRKWLTHPSKEMLSQQAFQKKESLKQQSFEKNHIWALLAGALWMLSTQVSGSMNNFSTLQSLVWLPLIAYWGLSVFSSPWARVWFAVSTTLQFLGGYPQHVLYAIFLAGVLAGFRDFQRETWRKTLFSWLKSWFITAVLVLGLSAVAWIPFTDMLLKSTRMEQTSQQALVGSLHPAMLIKSVLPYFFDNPATGMKWGPAWSGQPNVGIYISWLGIVAIVFSLFRKNIANMNAERAKVWRQEKVFFLVLTVTTLVFSFGQYLPGFEMIQKIFPLFRIARYPSMVMIMTNVVLIVWAVRSLQNLKLSAGQSRWLLGLGLLSLVGAGVGWAVTFWQFEAVWNWLTSFAFPSLSGSPFHTLERDKIILLEIFKNIIYNSLFFLASFYFFSLKKTQTLVFLLALELLVNTQGLFFFAPASIYDSFTISSQQLKEKMQFSQHGFENRILTRNSNTPYTDYGSYWEAMVVRAPFSDSFVDDSELKNFDHVKDLKNGFTPNWNMVFGVPTVHGYTTLLPRDYAHLWKTSETPRINFIEQLDPHNPLLDEWAVKYYLVDTWFAVKEDLADFVSTEKVDSAQGSGRWHILERPDALSRFRWEDGSNEGITVMRETPNFLELSLVQPNNTQEKESKDTNTEVHLIVADRYDVDWQVFINGKQQQIENFHGMRRIRLSVGEWQDDGKATVVMRYSPYWFWVGLAVSGITASGVLLWWCRSHRVLKRKAIHGK